MMRRYLCALSALALVLSTACSRPAATTAAATATAAAVPAATATDATTAVVAATAVASAVAGTTSATTLSGITSAARAIPSTFNVAWKPQTVQIDAATVSAAFRGVGDDGSLTFDAATAPTIAALVPNNVVIFSGLMLARVTSVTNSGGVLHVNVTPAALDDAIASGTISWKTAAIDWGSVAFTPPPGLHRVEIADDPILRVERFFAAPASASGSAVHYAGKVKKWSIKLNLTPQNGNLQMDLDASKTIDGGTIDVHGVGELDNLTNSVNITLNSGATTRIDFDAGSLHGKVDFTWSVAFDKEHGGNKLPELNETDVESLPFALTYPMLVGPIPFKLRIASGFVFAPTFTSKVTVAQGHLHQSFGGDVSLASTTSNGAPSPAASAAASPAAAGAPGDTSSTMTSDVENDAYGGTMSVAPLGLSTTLMLPSISLALGGPPEFDKLLAGGPYALLFTQANFIATGPISIAACERREINFIVSVGYSTGMLSKVLKPWRKEVFRKTNSVVIPPNIRLCQPH